MLQFLPQPFRQPYGPTQNRIKLCIKGFNLRLISDFFIYKFARI